MHGFTGVIRIGFPEGFPSHGMSGHFPGDVSSSAIGLTRVSVSRTKTVIFCDNKQVRLGVFCVGVVKISKKLLWQIVLPRIFLGKGPRRPKLRL